MLDSLGISIFVPENNIVITVKQMFFFFKKQGVNKSGKLPAESHFFLAYFLSIYQFFFFNK